MENTSQHFEPKIIVLLANGSSIGRNGLPYLRYPFAGTIWLGSSPDKISKLLNRENSQEKTNKRYLQIS